jgi:hypothetical protein
LGWSGFYPAKIFLTLESNMDSNDSWKTKTFIIGAIIGTLTGLGAAYIIVQRAQTENTRPKVTPGEGVKVGLGILGLLRLVADIGLGK